MKLLFQYIIVVFLSINCNKKPISSDTKNTQNKKFEYTVSEAADWDNVFIRNNGWFGGDGIFCLNRNGKEVIDTVNPDIMFWFSDSMFGDIVNNTPQPGFVMINNAVALTTKNTSDKDAINYYSAYTNDNKPQSVFIPSTTDATIGEYYWLGDGFANQSKNNDIYLFGYRIKNISQQAFGFKETGNNLIIIPSGALPPFKNQRQVDIPFFKNLNIDSTGSFGAGVLVNTKAAGVEKGDGYIYIYGVRGIKKEIIVARVYPEEIENFTKWSFWDGSGFSSNPVNIKPVAINASNELSVSALSNGQYILVSQKGLNGKIYFQLGSSPVGPFEEAVEIYDPAIKFKSQPNYFTYNAKAHPVISQPGELVISYNVNSFKFLEDIVKEPHLYRPRFIRLQYVFK